MILVSVVAIICLISASAEQILFVSTITSGSQKAVVDSIIFKLLDRGHSATILVGDQFVQTANYSSVDNVDTIFYNSQRDENEHPVIPQFMMKTLGKFINGSVLQGGWQFISGFSELLAADCEKYLGDERLLNEIKQRNFSMIVGNGIGMCAILLGEKVSKPYITLFPVSFDFMDTFFRAANVPRPLSYVPSTATMQTDSMTFWQRLLNVIASSIYAALVDTYLMSTFSSLKMTYTPGTNGAETFQQTLTNSELFLITGDWSFDYPRPLMPATIGLGGVTATGEINPLSKELEEFIESSGKEGIILSCFGSFIELSDEIISELTKAYSRLPTKVLWKGQIPTHINLSNNIKALKWLPLKDLLAHPKTRAMVYPGGINGIYEAIKYGVPIVGIPICQDQFDNIVRLTSKGMAPTKLDVSSLKADEIYEKITEVLNNTRFKKHALMASEIFNDYPISPSEKAAFWIETVMRYGSDDLRSKPELNILQYFLIDVYAFIIIGFFILYYSLKYLAYFVRNHKK